MWRFKTSKLKIDFFELEEVEGKTTAMFTILAHRALLADQLGKSCILPFALLFAVLIVTIILKTTKTSSYKRKKIPYCASIPIWCSIFLIKTNWQWSKINNVNTTYKYTLTGKGTKGTKKLLHHLLLLFPKAVVFLSTFMYLTQSLSQNDDRICPKTDTFTQLLINTQWIFVGQEWKEKFFWNKSLEHTASEH